MPIRESQKGQVMLEYAISLIGVVAIFYVLLNVWTWCNRMLIKRQESFQSTREAAGRVRSAGTRVPYQRPRLRLIGDSGTDRPGPAELPQILQTGLCEAAADSGRALDDALAAAEQLEAQAVCWSGVQEKRLGPRPQDPGGTIAEAQAAYDRCVDDDHAAPTPCQCPAGVEAADCPGFWAYVLLYRQTIDPMPDTGYLPGGVRGPWGIQCHNRDRSVTAAHAQWCLSVWADEEEDWADWTQISNERMAYADQALANASWLRREACEQRNEALRHAKEGAEICGMTIAGFPASLPDCSALTPTRTNQDGHVEQLLPTSLPIPPCTRQTN